MIHVALHKEKRGRKEGSENVYYQNGTKKSDRKILDGEERRKQVKNTLSNSTDGELTVTPVALIHKFDFDTNINLNADNCIILPVNSDDKDLNMVDSLPGNDTIPVSVMPTNNVQFIYNGTGDLVELTDGKEKT